MSLNEEEEIKEIYARFGVAMYFAQVLEKDLVNALTVLDFLPSHLRAAASPQAWLIEVVAFMDCHFESTLGKLIRSFAAVTSVPLELEELLRQALSKRNWLAHEYFRERVTGFLTPEGRGGMIEELEDSRALFERVAARLEELVVPVRQRYGLTQKKIEELQRAMIAKARGDG